MCSFSNLCEIVEATKCDKAIGKSWCWTNRTSLWGWCITKKTLRKPNQLLNLSAIKNTHKKKYSGLYLDHSA